MDSRYTLEHESVCWWCNVLGRSLKYIRGWSEDLEITRESVKLRINKNKTKVMCRQEEEDIKWKLNLWRYQLEVVSAFSYLGCYLRRNSSETEEVKCRISVANRVYFSLVPLFKRCQPWGWGYYLQDTYPTNFSLCQWNMGAFPQFHTNDWFLWQKNRVENIWIFTG